MQSNSKLFKVSTKLIIIKMASSTPVRTGKETYDEWLDCKGFEFSGNSSFFPHMSDDWKDTVEENVRSQGLGNSVYCLREEDACCVIGNKKISLVTSGPPLQ